MTDKARKKTDQELKKLEREIYELYATSSAELSEKWRKYMSSHKKKLDKLYDNLEKAKGSGNRDDIKAAQEEYERAVKNVTLNDNRYKAMINETTAKIAHVNEIALGYANDETPKIYTLNYNAFGDEKIDGYTFTLVNEQAVKNLIESDKIELPPKKLDIPKDRAWNAKNINSQLLQGILQGENIAKIAKRLQNVTDMNKKSAIRNARTMVTGAENKGRQDSFKKAQSDGVIMTRKWVATSDERTRAWHRDLDGQEVGIDEPWENDYGEIMFPGDPTADPANVYNCRCSIRAHVKGFDWSKKEETAEVEEVKEENNNLNLLSDKTIEAIESYTGGEEFNLKQDQFDEIKHAMQITEQPLYRVESIRRTAEQNLLDVEDEFNFSQYVFESKDKTEGALRSFTRSIDALPDLLGQVDDAVIFKTVGEVEHLPIDTLSQFQQAESLAFGNDWIVEDIENESINGRKYTVYIIRRLHSR